MKSFRHLLWFFLLACLISARAAEAPAPGISLSLRGVADATVEQGEPLRIAVRVSAPRGAKEAITLAPASGSWSEAIAVELAPVGGGAPVARAEALGKPDSPTATLDKAHVAGGLWRFKAQAMQSIPPGKYVVRARLAIRGGSGWTGEVVSRDTPLEIVATTETAVRVSQRTLNRAQDALLDGRTEEAASILDVLLTKTPDDARALTARAEVALRAGNPIAAMICLNRASPKSGNGQPPIEREELLTRVMSAMHKGTTPSVPPPKWSWPPESVMEANPEQKALVQKALEANATNKASPATPPVAIPAAPVAVSIVAPRPTPVAPTSPVQPAVVSTPSPVFALPPATATTPALAAIGVVVPAREFTDAKVTSESKGQWAVSATAGSQYDKRTYSAAKATGAPDVSVAGNSPDAWCPAGKNTGTDWLEVVFAKPVHATEVRVRQNDTVGAISKIEAIDSAGATHVWWEGVDPYVASATREIVWFAVRVPKTDYLVAKVKITLNLAAVTGWKEIDAVQLVGAAP